MKDIKGVLFYLTTNVRYPFSIFWFIILAIFALSLTISFINNSPDVLFQASIPIYIFCLVLGMWTVKNTIPYLLKMSVTRKLIFIGIGIYFLVIAIVQAVLANLLIKAIGLFDKSAMAGDVSLYNGYEGYDFKFTHLSQFLQNDSFLSQITIDTIISFAALTTMFFIGLLFYRYGLIGGFSFIGVMFLAYIVSIATGSFVDLIKYIFANYSLGLYFQVFGMAILIYLLSFLMLRRLTIVSS